MNPTDAFERLVNIMARLRSPGGCPWDREQTLATLRPFLLEETYEVLEAMESGDARAHCDELGDLLLQVVFQARVREEAGEFSIGDVATAIADKLVRRHPHVFGDGSVVADDSATVMKNWAEIKATEKAAAGTPRKSALDGVPAALPALLRATRIGEKAAAAGFDWRAPGDVLDKLDEEAGELREALARQDLTAVEAELGDYLFTIVNVCRHLGVDAEAALRGTTQRFEDRFRALETGVQADGHITLRALDDTELERRWQAAKRALEGRS
jgi:MazG family protein